MDNLWLHASAAFVGYFAIMNPIANVPIFVGLTADTDRQTTKSIALRALLIAFVIIAVFSIAGQLIFSLFDITLHALRITGGLIVFLIGFHMLQGEHSSVHHLSDEENKDCQESALGIAVSPLAMPILAGPGTIATAVSLSAAGSMEQMLAGISAFAVLCLATYVLFLSGEKLVALAGAGIIGVITRVMGLILAVMGTQMVLLGIQGAFSLSGSV